MKTLIHHFALFALISLVLSPLVVAHASPPPADSVHFYAPFDYEQWERDRPRSAAKRLLDEDHGLTGRGVTVAILDRGIDWSHPDFIRPDGTTRILWLLDMTGQNSCDPNTPAPVEYSASQINEALTGGAKIDSQDAVGHGTVTAGIAAGNGSAFADGKYAGLAPQADLIVVKITSEGAPAHDGQPAEEGFNGCTHDALDWLDKKMDLLEQPTVALINSGVQFGPIDGTSAVSRKIDEVFGLNRPGRVYVSPAGDEGGLPNHSGADYDNTGDTVVSLTKKRSSEASYMYIWYTGNVGAEVTVEFASGTRVGPVGPGEFMDKSGITISQMEPGQEFYPWQSTSGDRAVWIRVQGHEGPGSVRVRAVEPGSGHFDLYGDQGGANLTSTVTFSGHLVSGRLNDYSSTTSAIVVGAHVARHQYTDIDGIPRNLSSEGLTGDLWFQSSGGPTRDGRLPGVDITAPGHNTFAALAQNSYWATGRWNMVRDGGGWYVRGGATSGAAPIVVGAVALMLELKPDLTAEQVRAILRDTAVSDTATGTTPNPDWGFGKLNLSGAIGAVQKLLDVPDRGDFTQAADPPYHGTVWINPDIITSSDPTAFQDITAAGRGERTMFDRRVSGWITINAYLFNAQFDDGLTSEIQVNPEFGSASAALAEAIKYGRVIGQLPTVLRTDVETVWIHKGNHPLGGGNNNILIHVDRAEDSKKGGFLEEELVHEGAHSSLDPTHSEDPDWIAAQKADGNFISTYARDYPKREDIAESFLSYLAVRYRSARVSPSYEKTILKTIPNRIVYFDAQSFDDAMYPVIADLRLSQTLTKVSGDNQQGTPAAALAHPLVVEVRNQNGTVLEGIQVRLAVASGGGQLSVETTMTDSSGRAASTLILGHNPGTNTVTVSVAGLDPVTFTATAEATPDFDGDGEMVFGFAEEVEDQAYTAGATISALVLPEATGGEGEITYRVSGLPAGLSFDDSTRTISGTPEAATDGAVEITYTAEDSAGAATTLTFSITVNPPLGFGDFFDLFGAGGG